MPNSSWEHARKALIFYFSRRHCLDQAEDLAQETLSAVWARHDYFFAADEDFLLVCYGFARRILQEGYRDRKKHESEELSSETTPALPESNGLNRIEMDVLLREISEIGRNRLRPLEWRLIELAATSDRSTMAAELQISDPNSLRVQLHRARKKLAKLIGWSRNGQ